jgi:hypothetical protein
VTERAKLSQVRPLARIFALFFIVLSASRADAQDPGAADPLEGMPIHWGALGLTPTLSVTNFGVDSNIFNDASDPKSDFTMTVTPRLQARLRAQRALFAGSVATGLVYFQTYDEERSIDYITDGRVDLDLSWLRPYASASLTETSERLNAEVDARAPRTQTAISGGARFRTATRAGFVVDFKREGLDFDQGTFFEGVPLSRMLNSTTQTIEGGLELYLTPLTTLSLLASRETDRFEQSPSRDSNTFRFMPGLRMEAPAVVQGSIAIGYRRFDAVDPQIPDYTGVIVHGSLSHVIAERTKIDLSVSRDVQYSFEVAQPYYLTTGFRLTLAYQLIDDVDLRAYGGRERLGYRDALAVASPVSTGSGDDRTDRVGTLGAGAGYRLRPNLRVGVDVEYAKRDSDRPDRRYDRTRLFGSMTYGL